MPVASLTNGTLEKPTPCLLNSRQPRADSRKLKSLFGCHNNCRRPERLLLDPNILTAGYVMNIAVISLITQRGSCGYRRPPRSEERRVGKERVSTCRYGGGAYH